MHTTETALQRPMRSHNNERNDEPEPEPEQAAARGEAAAWAAAVSIEQHRPRSLLCVQTASPSEAQILAALAVEHVRAGHLLRVRLGKLGRLALLELVHETRVRGHERVREPAHLLR